MTILVGGLGGPERERMVRPTGCNLCAPICECGAEEAQACRTLQDREAPGPVSVNGVAWNEWWASRVTVAAEGDMDALLAAFHGEGTEVSPPRPAPSDPGPNHPKETP